VVSIWRIHDAGLITDCRVYRDLTPVYTPLSTGGMYQRRPTGLYYSDTTGRAYPAPERRRKEPDAIAIPARQRRPADLGPIFASVQALFDPVTVRHLEATDVQTSRHCLEASASKRLDRRKFTWG
jgi:hypothetical protein